MGIKELSTRDIKELKKILFLFDAIGLSEDSLRKIPEMLKFYEMQKDKQKNESKSATSVMTDKERKKTFSSLLNVDAPKDETIARPADYVALFAADTEEFNPYGKRSEN